MRDENIDVILWYLVRHWAITTSLTENHESIYPLKSTSLYLQDEGAKQAAKLMYQTALLESGFILSDPKDFASQIYDTVKNSLNISPDAAVEEEDEAEVESPSQDTEAEESIKSEADEPLKDEL